MTFPRLPSIPRQPPARDLLDAARHQLRGRRGLMIVAGAALAIGLAANWSWLVAVGLAPLLLGVLPCLAMCALGLCMNRFAGRSCAAEHSPSTTLGEAATADGLPAQPVLGEPPILERGATEADPVAAAMSAAAVEPRPVETRSTSDA